MQSKYQSNEQVSENEIVNLYTNDKKPITYIANNLGVSIDDVKNVLSKNEVLYGRKNKKYWLDETYFDKITTPNQAYVLGFLYADGSNNISKTTVSMSLQEEDFEILEKIRIELCNERPLEFIDYSSKHDFGYTYKNQYRLLIFSKRICGLLNDIGMVPNKSLKLTYPNVINKELHSHFIRGYFDGDGSICRYRMPNRDQVNVTITSTEEFCNSIKNICMDELNINVGIYDASCHNGRTKVATIGGINQCKQFMDWIYKDAELYLERKYLRYCDYYNIENSKPA